jgi:hypothetical protein
MTALGCKELLQKKDGKETNLTHAQEDSFVGLTSYINDADVKTYETPVIKRNESCFADITGVWEILREIIPEE